MFKSTIYDYSIALPAGWIAIPATAAWDGKEMSHDAAYVDQFQFPNGTVGWAAATPTKKTLVAFSADRTAADAAEHPCPAKPEVDQPITIAGGPARLTVKHCPAEGGIVVANAAAIHGGTGYFFYFQDPGHAADATDLDTFKTLLSGVMLP